MLQNLNALSIRLLARLRRYQEMHDKLNHLATQRLTAHKRETLSTRYDQLTGRILEAEQLLSMLNAAIKEVLKEFSNANRTKVTVLGFFGGNVVVYEFTFDKDTLYGNHLKNFQDEARPHYNRSKSPYSMEEAEEIYEELERQHNEYTVA